MAPDDGTAAVVQHSPLLEQYEAIANTSRQMLAAARGDRWDEVSALEAHCQRLIVALKDAASGQPLDAGDDRRRLALLRRILADDAEIRGCAEPWWGEVEDLIHGRVRAAH